MIRVSIFASVLMCFCFLAPMARGSTRDEVIGKLQTEVKVVGIPGASRLSEADERLCLEAVRNSIRRNAVELLPDNLPTADTFIAEPLLIPINVQFKDDKYLEMMGRVAILSVRPSMEFLAEHPPLTLTERKHLSDMVDEAFDSATKTMNAKLTSKPLLFDHGRVEKQLAASRRRVMSMLGNPYNAMLKKAPADASVKLFLKEFDIRVSASVDTVQAQIRDPRTSSAPVSNRDMFERSVCRDILGWFEAHLSQLTIDPKRQIPIETESGKQFNTAYSELQELMRKLQQHPLDRTE